MLANYLKILFRSFSRNKTFSTINILGLSVGLTCFLLISLYVADEFSFDRHHEKLDRIYMVVTEASFAGETHRWTGVPNKVAPTIAKEIPEIERAVRLFPHDFGKLAFVSTPTMKSTEKMLAWADPEIFDVLSYSFLKGDPKVALARPNTAVVSEAFALKYFGTTEVLGKTINIDNKTELEITGVFKDPPPTSRFQYPILASFNSHWFAKESNQDWGNASFETYLLLHPGVEQAVVEKKIVEVLSRNIEKDNQWFSLSLKPLKDAYLYMGDIQDFANPEGKKGDIGQINILIALGLIVILIAAVNYMNLSTAQSQRRFKEIGISKTLGATSRQLARQFYTETSVFVLIAMLLSLLTAVLVLPVFRSVTGKFLTVSFLWNSWFWACLLFTWMLLSLLSGFYPALYLSSFSPKRVLKIASPGVGGNAFLRKGLVIVQFSTSIILIIGTIILYQQLNYMRDKKLGYKPEQVVAILTSGAENREQVNAFETEIGQISDVLSADLAQSFPGAGASGRNLPPLDGQGEGKSLYTVRANGKILDVLSIPLLAGKSLPENKVRGDTTIQVVLNKAATDFLKISPEDAVNRKIQINGFGPVEVVGVMDDFHFASLREGIGAYCFHNAKTESYNYLLIKLQTKDLTAALRQVEERYKKIIPSAFEFTFLDQWLESLYRVEKQLAEVTLIFASLAIFIACLGLYALAAYSTEQRTKEIGIRKALGATVIQLTNMLSKDFIRLVLISFIIAAPVGYFLMKYWLQSFAYRVDLNVFIFIGAGVISVVIAWFTVGLESARAAQTNPVDSLRNE